ncbi:MAG: hypothetical protein HWN68_20160 [Desulfobacterales bacterium]|nr:hypothetical protein [Desulfobacterales bacterium]
MFKVSYLKSKSQELIFVFDFINRIVYVFMVVRGRPVEAKRSRRTFDPLEYFGWFEDLGNPDRGLSDLVLDCVWLGGERLDLWMGQALLDMLGKVDQESINFAIYGKAKQPGEAIYWGDIGFIVLCVNLEKDRFPKIKNDVLSTVKVSADSIGGLGEVYHPGRIEQPKPVRYQEEKRRRDHLRLIEKKKGLPSVGRKLKLAYLPAELLNEPTFYTMSLGAQEVYRIYRTYAKIPSGESLYSYVQTGIAQTQGLLVRRRTDMMMSGTKEKRRKAAKMGVSERNVKRYIAELDDRKWLYYVVRGRPGIPGESAPRVNKFLVVMSEEQRIYLIEEAKEREEDTD